MAWTVWSACDDTGLQLRTRECGTQGSTPCVGNSTQTRDCNEIPGERSHKQQAHAGQKLISINFLHKSSQKMKT